MAQTTVSQDITITVTDRADVDPAFTSGATATLAENSTATGYTPAATTDLGDTAAFTITGGADQALFELDSNGQLVFSKKRRTLRRQKAALRMTATRMKSRLPPQDSSNLSSTQTVAVTVTNLDEEAPVFDSLGTAEVDENIPVATVVYTAEATDTDNTGPGITFSLATNGDNDLFAIDGSTGEVTFLASPDHENPLDEGGDNDYEITVIASDGTNETEHDVTITVNDVDDRATVIDLGALGDDGEADGTTNGGADAGSRTGFEVSDAGDVNGDGYDDFIVAGNYGDDVYVIYGGQDIDDLDFSNLSPSQGLILEGVTPVQFASMPQKVPLSRVREMSMAMAMTTF